MTGMKIDPEEIKRAANELNKIEEVFSNCSSNLPQTELASIVSSRKPEFELVQNLEVLVSHLGANLTTTSHRLGEHSQKLRSIADNHEETNANIASNFDGINYN